MPAVLAGFSGLTGAKMPVEHRHNLSHDRVADEIIQGPVIAAEFDDTLGLQLGKVLGHRGLGHAGRCYQLRNAPFALG